MAMNTSPVTVFDRILMLSGLTLVAMVDDVSEVIEIDIRSDGSGEIVYVCGVVG